jgi:ABC-2 type transport system permease protein
MRHEVRLLMRKEWRQLLRSRGALASALLFPLLFLLIIPGIQIVAINAAPAAGSGVNLPPGTSVPPALAAIGDDPKALLRILLLPLFVTISGLTVPSMTATYIVIAERENRTLDLLVALPIRVHHILLAKFLVIVLLAGAVTFVLYSVDAVLILLFDLASAGYVVALLGLLVGALAYSTASALLVSLLARDFRTANNLLGAAIGPTIVVSIGVLLFVGSGTPSIVVLAGIFALAAALAVLVALRVVTFERLLR